MILKPDGNTFTNKRTNGFRSFIAGLTQSVVRLTVERELAGSIPGAGPILRVLK